MTSVVKGHPSLEHIKHSNLEGFTCSLESKGSRSEGRYLLLLSKYKEFRRVLYILSCWECGKKICISQCAKCLVPLCWFIIVLSPNLQPTRGFFQFGFFYVISSCSSFWLLFVCVCFLLPSRTTSYQCSIPQVITRVVSEIGVIVDLLAACHLTLRHISICAPTNGIRSQVLVHDG